jgi:hypothetical protein
MTSNEQRGLDAVTPSPLTQMLWPIATDDQVEALALECDWNNRRFMKPDDYAIWCERMRKFVRLASYSVPPNGGITVEFCQKIIAEMGRIIGDLQAELDKAKTP